METSAQNSAITVFTLAKSALGTIRTSRSLWLFGLFAGGAVGGGAPVHSTSGGGGSNGGMPSWILALIVGLALFGLLAAVLHFISTSALVLGVQDSLKGKALGVREGLRRGRRFAWRVFIAQFVTTALQATLVAVVALPIVAGVFDVVPLWLGIAFAAIAGVPAALAALSLYFISQYATRMVVLEDRPAVEALRNAEGFLRGRLLDAIKTLLAESLGSYVGSLVAVVIVLPAVILGLVVGIVAGLTLGLIAGGALGAALLPLALTVLGARGAYCSSVWTLSYLQGRNA